MHDFGWALLALNGNNKVTRQGWEPGMFIRLSHIVGIDQPVMLLTFPDGKSHVWSLPQSDIQARDWDLYIEKD